MRTPTRRLATLAAVAALTLSAAACGDDSSDDTGGDGGSSAEAQEQLAMGITVATVSLNFAIAMSDGATLAAEHDGNVDFQVAGPPAIDGPAQVQMFQSLVTTATDGVILENLTPPLFTRPAADAVAAGVPIVNLDTSPTEGSGVTFYVGNDNYDLGVQMADALLAELGDDPQGEVVVGVPNPAAPVLDFRARGIIETLNEKAPGIEVFGPFETFSEPAKNYDSWSAQANAHPDALAMLGVGDADSYNLARLKQERESDWFTAGFDVDAKTLQAVKDGTNFMAMDPQHFLKGYVASALMIDAKREGTELPEGWLVGPGFIITQENVDEIIAREESPDAAYEWYKPQIDEMIGMVPSGLEPLEDAR